jgi:hypothetical protein
LSNERRSYDPERYWPATVAALQMVGGSSAKAFVIAGAVGRLIKENGSTDRLRNGREAAASVIVKNRLPAALEAIGINRRQWNSYVTDWEDRYIAHRCADGAVCLFTRPLLPACPACKAEIAVNHVAPSPRTNRRRAARTGSITASGRAVMLPETGSITARGWAVPAPLLRTDEPHQKTGLLGIEVGAPSCSGCGHLHFPTPSQTGVSEIGALAVQAVQSAGGCRNVGCGCEGEG